MASVISFVLWLPQASTVWSRRADTLAMAGVSLGTQFLVLANALIWGLYALETKAFWVGAPGLINAPLAIGIITLVLISRREALHVGSQLDQGPGCPSCAEGLTHWTFVTAPAGWGSVMTCTGVIRRDRVPVHNDDEIKYMRSLRAWSSPLEPQEKIQP